jgi:uncharacterized protein (TIGR00297 family)
MGNPDDISQKISKLRHLKRGLIGLTLSALISFVSWRKDSLSRTGIIGAVLTGTATTWAGGYGRSALLVGFFTASSLLSRLPQGELSFDSIAEKGSNRDIWQVFANGGVSTAIATRGDGPTRRLPYLGALAAAAGDTWATEIGTRVGATPRHVLTLRPVEPGASGGVTVAGTIASACGGAFIGSLAVAAGLIDRSFAENRLQLVIVGVMAGSIGSLVDSVAGATIQERRWCNECGRLTEQPVHLCGRDTTFAGGVPGLNNDAVNVIGTVSGALVGYLAGRLLCGKEDETTALE